MKVKYIGLSDSRVVASSDLPQLSHEGDEDQELWSLTWHPEEVLEIGDELGTLLVRGMKNEFRDVTLYQTDAEQAQADEETPLTERLELMEKSELRAEMRARNLGSRNMDEDEMRSAIRSHDGIDPASPEAPEEA